MAISEGNKSKFAESLKLNQMDLFSTVTRFAQTWTKQTQKHTHTPTLHKDTQTINIYIFARYGSEGER